MNYIILVAAFQALIAFVLSFMNRRGASGSALSWLLALIFLHLGGNFLINVAFPASETHKGFPTFISFFYGPALWMYAVSLAATSTHRSWWHYIHFLPGIVAAIAYFTIAAYTIAHDGRTPPAIYYYNVLASYSVQVSFIGYSISAWLLSRRITSFWKEEKRLVQLIAGLFLLVCLPWLPMQSIPYFSPNFIPTESAHYWFRIYLYLILLVICLAIIWVKFLGMKYTNTAVQATKEEQAMHQEQEQRQEGLQYEMVTVLAEPVIVNQQLDPNPETEQTKKRLILSAEQHAVLAADIRMIMEKDKLYVDPALTLDSLAATMKVSRNHLSEVLNQHIGQSFYQYINEYRIRQVVKLMDRCKKEQVSPNILSLAFEAGFHSKSSFNQYFKKVMGCTPSAYMKTEMTSLGYAASGLPLREA